MSGKGTFHQSHQIFLKLVGFSAETLIDKLIGYTIRRFLPPNYVDP